MIDLLYHFRILQVDVEKGRTSDRNLVVINGPVDITEVIDNEHKTQKICRYLFYVEGTVLDLHE